MDLLGSGPRGEAPRCDRAGVAGGELRLLWVTGLEDVPGRGQVGHTVQDLLVDGLGQQFPVLVAVVRRWWWDVTALAQDTVGGSNGNTALLGDLLGFGHGRFGPVCQSAGGDRSLLATGQA